MQIEQAFRLEHTASLLKTGKIALPPGLSIACHPVAPYQSVSRFLEWESPGVMLLMGGLQASYQASFTVGSIVTLCEPLTASLLATFFLHETLHATGLLGAALLLGALVLFLLAPRK